MKAADRIELFRRLAELNPEPTTELEYSTPFELLVAVTLSAQATDVGVNKATRRLFPVANTPQAIWELGEEGLKRYISSIGLYNKAKNIIAPPHPADQHGGDVPRASTRSLPGVGRKTAMSSTPPLATTIAVDALSSASQPHGLAPGKNVNEVERKLLRNVPTQYRRTPTTG